MNAKDVILNSMNNSEMVINAYIGDLEDRDLLIRPEAGMNHIAWQIGHLIGAEKFFVDLVKAGASPELPEGFAEWHGKERSTDTDTSKYYSRARYQEMWKAQRDATKAVLEELSDEELSRTSPDFPPFIPTVGAVFNMCGLHPLMHAGQFVAVRRKLGKPVVI